MSHFSTLISEASTVSVIITKKEVNINEQIICPFIFIRLHPILKIEDITQLGH
jgi:hypothetical protein